MSRGGYFTIDEVIEATGFDRRTIAYYVQEGLLPKVGRRGRLTRYPQKVVDRLLFSKLLRDAEESGERPVPMTLAEIRDALDRIPAKKLHVVANGMQPLSLVDRYLEPTDNAVAAPAASEPPPERWKAALEAPPDLAPRASRRDFMLEETGDPDLYIPRARPAARLRLSFGEVAESRGEYADNDSEVDACMEPESLLDERPAQTGPPDDILGTLLSDLCRRTVHEHSTRGAAESWSRVAVTPGLEIAARDADHHTRSLLDRIARLLRRRLDDPPDRR